MLSIEFLLPADIIAVYGKYIFWLLISKNLKNRKTSVLNGSLKQFQWPNSFLISAIGCFSSQC